MNSLFLDPLEFPMELSSVFLSSTESPTVVQPRDESFKKAPVAFGDAEFLISKATVVFEFLISKATMVSAGYHRETAGQRIINGFHNLLKT